MLGSGEWLQWLWVHLLVQGPNTGQTRLERASDNRLGRNSFPLLGVGSVAGGSAVVADRLLPA